ncbi:MAG: hypothetical protein ACRBB3_00700 [Alphaproteobacteria bacterium]
MSDGILLKKPPNFTPYFVAKLKEKRSVAWPVFCLFVMCWCVYGEIVDGEAWKVAVMLLVIAFLVFYISIIIRVNRNLHIIEISESVIWLCMRGVFIPKDRFYKAIHDERIVPHQYMGRVKHKDIYIMFKITRRERLSLTLRSIGTSVIYKLSPTQYQVTKLIPYTRGLGEEIELNVTKTELINALNSFSGGS